MELNNWIEPEVNRAEKSWGQKTPPYTADMFDFIIERMGSWVDLGCGFGRFLNHLTNLVVEPDYKGFDSSPDMTRRLVENYPPYQGRIFTRNITDPIKVDAEAWICSAVLIHITLEEQKKVLQNILNNKPKKATFDINSPAERWSLNNEAEHFERRIKGAVGAFRMTWQSHYAFTRRIIKMFGELYSISVKYYKLNFTPTRYKVVYFLEKLHS